MQLVAIALGGATGAVLRYLMTNFVSSTFAVGTHWAIVGVNVLGSILMGFAVGGFETAAWVSPHIKLFLMVGLLGGFTTFSTFSMDAVRLLEAGQTTEAFIHMGASLLLTVLACGLGLWLSRIILT
jgi:CrcB protein